MISNEERVRIRHHLGFPNIGNRAVISLGVLAGGLPTFILESAMTNLLPEAETLMRNALTQCDCIEAQMGEARTRMKTAAVEGVILRAREELEDLEDQYDYWTSALVDFFGVIKNPWSNKLNRVSGGTTVIGPE